MGFDSTMIRREKCGYRSDDWPENHQCARSKGHSSRHVCWCGTLHESGSDYSGRWENYIKPELSGKRNA